MQGRPIRDFIIQSRSTFENEHELSNGKKLILSSVTEDAFQQRKSAKVVATPMMDNGFNIEVGDEIFFKHTVLRHMWIEEEKKQYSQFLLDPVEDLYRVPVNMIWAYKKGDSFNVTEDWVVVEPKIKEDEIRPSGIIIPGMNKELSQIGTIVYIGSKLESEGYKVGDTVIWDRNSEYEVKINQKRFYRMNYEWIIGKYES